MCIRDSHGLDLTVAGQCFGGGIIGQRDGIAHAGILHGLDAVSYTHLDVYKRQGKDVICIYVAIGQKRSTVAVSYTHLDVYKRQNRKSPRNDPALRPTYTAHVDDHFRTTEMLSLIHI